MVLCGFIILIHCNWLLFGFFVLYFALFGSVFHLLLDKCRMYVNIYHIYRNLSREAWCSYMYNRDDYKVSKTNGAIIGGRDDPHGFKDFDLVISILKFDDVPKTSFTVYQVNRYDPRNSPVFKYLGTSCSKDGQGQSPGPMNYKPFFSCYE